MKKFCWHQQILKDVSSCIKNIIFKGIPHLATRKTVSLARKALRTFLIQAGGEEYLKNNA